MGLRAQAALDAQAILTNTDDFGWPITVTDPAGTSAALTGFSNDITQVIDPQTGAVVSGRTATAALSIATLTEAGFTELPYGVVSAGQRPWVIAFDDINGQPWTFKVMASDPDRTLGIVVCFLEEYQS